MEVVTQEVTNTNMVDSNTLHHRNMEDMARVAYPHLNGIECSYCDVVDNRCSLSLVR